MKYKEKHISVLTREVIEYLKVVNSGVYVDGTVGAGGHAEAILEASAPGGIVIGLDRDGSAIRMAEERLGEYAHRLRLIHGNFERLADRVRSIGVEAVNGIVLDLGISSMQIDDPMRGFSFQSEGPLDMRMSQEGDRMASHILNESPEVDLVTMFEAYGEERYARRIARRIVHCRRQQPILTTSALKDVIRQSVPAHYRTGRLHCATRVFQALRIAVNDELGALSRGIQQAVSLLAPGGRLGVIAFHSLEDRIVKQSVRALARVAQPTVIELCKKPLRPSEDERRRNPRSRSAKLRVVEKVAS